MNERRRIATRGDERIRGVAVVSDKNGPGALRFRIDGILELITLNTGAWDIQWESPDDSE